MIPSTVYIVHCVDTEGPLYESLQATFGRIENIFHLKLEPSRETLVKLQNGQLDLGGKEEAVRKVVAPKLLAYNDTWDKIDIMLAKALSSSFRNEMLDSKGNGWAYNWFCVDHVGYTTNPRRRDIGYHNIFDHYRSALREFGGGNDGFHFHFHPVPFSRRANQCATHWWAASDNLYQVLSRRIIDRHWFPCANRPGFHTERPDSHWFLEQFIPFDMASQSIEESSIPEQQFDMSLGRFGDWRFAPKTWEPYHPAHDNYQSIGECRRWLARCLNIGTRIRNLTHRDVDQAFQEAQEGKPVVMAFCNHDFRDICEDVGVVQEMISEASRNFPEVSFEFCEAAYAMRQALQLPQAPPCDLDLHLEPIGNAHRLTVTTGEPTFGPQPYLAIKTVDQAYYHDNFDFQEPFKQWTYTFDEETFALAAVESIGVAANNKSGVTTVSTMNIADGTTQKVTLHGL